MKGITVILIAVLMTTSCSVSKEQTEQNEQEKTSETKPARVMTHKEEPMKTQSIKLSDFGWEKRIVVLYATDKENESYQTQLIRISNSKKDFEERNLITISIFKDSENGYLNNDPIDIDSTEAIVDRFDLNEENRNVAILVGYDGGEKERYELPVELEKIYALIDTMSIRQMEMRSEN